MMKANMEEFLPMSKSFLDTDRRHYNSWNTSGHQGALDVMNLSQLGPTTVLHATDVFSLWITIVRG